MFGIKKRSGKDSSSVFKGRSLLVFRYYYNFPQNHLRSVFTLCPELKGALRDHINNCNDQQRLLVPATLTKVINEQIIPHPKASTDSRTDEVLTSKIDQVAPKVDEEVVSKVDGEVVSKVDGEVVSKVDGEVVSKVDGEVVSKMEEKMTESGQDSEEGKKIDEEEKMDAEEET